MSTYSELGKNVWGAVYTLKFQIITYLVVPRFSRSCDSHFDLAIVHLIEIFHIGDRIHLEMSMRNTGFKLKDKMSRLQVKFVIFASICKKLWSNVNKTVFWVKRKVHLQFTQPLKHFLKIWFSNCNYSAFCKSLDLLMLTLQRLNIKQHFIENKYLKPRYTHKS